MQSAAVATELEQENPLIEGLERLPVRPTSLVIFGATGDLAHRKLLPALYNLAHEGALPERFELIGVARSEYGHDEFRDMARESIERFSRRRPDPKVLSGLTAEMRYVPGGFDDDKVYGEIGNTLREFDKRAGEPLNRVFYLSPAPQFFPVIAGKLGGAGLSQCDRADTRIVIEKPFGYDLASAQQLNAEVLEVFEEPQVFRIDHYLGKETVQNLMALRFANALFEPVWNRNFIDHVQITAAEDIGIGGRAGYYEGAGALRDLVQNHMMQLLALLTMEPPASFDADRVRDEKLKVLEIVVTLKPVPHLAFKSIGSVGVQPNQIILTVQPDEGVSVSLGAKIPGAQMRIRPVNMEFRYGTSFLSESPEAYERLILDAMRGDATLFTRNDEIEALWGIIDPILEAWSQDKSSTIPQYESGTPGPREANALLVPGQIWRRL